MTVQKSKRCGFTVVEMLVSLAVMAIVLTAVAFAFNASAINYNENFAMFSALNTGRQAMMQMTSELRTASELDKDSPPNMIRFFESADANQFLAFKHEGTTLYRETESCMKKYPLCENVSDVNFFIPPTTGTTQSVQMSMTVTVKVGNRSEKTSEKTRSQIIKSEVVLQKTL